MPTPIAENIVELGEQACDLNEACEVVLPSGRAILLVPALGLDALAKALRDPAFEASIRRAAEDLRLGRGGEIDA